jgi:hypothetical protein
MGATCHRRISQDAARRTTQRRDAAQSSQLGIISGGKLASCLASRYMRNAQISIHARRPRQAGNKSDDGSEWCLATRGRPTSGFTHKQL